MSIITSNRNVLVGKFPNPLHLLLVVFSHRMSTVGSRNRLGLIRNNTRRVRKVMPQAKFRVLARLYKTPENTISGRKHN